MLQLRGADRVLLARRAGALDLVMSGVPTGARRAALPVTDTKEAVVNRTAAIRGTASR